MLARLSCVLLLALPAAGCSGDDFVDASATGGTSGTGGTSVGGTGGLGGGAACETWCKAPATCDDEVCVIAPKQNGPEFLVADGSHLYWSDYSQVRRVVKDGSSAPQTLIEEPSNNFEFVAVDHDHVFASNDTARTVLRANKTGGNGIALATGLQKPKGIGLDDAHVYFADQILGTLMRVPKDGSSSAAEYVTGQVNPEAVSIDATTVFWTAKDGVFACAKGATCTAPSNLGASHPPDGSPHIALDATRVYWTTPNGIASAPKDASAGVTELVTDLPAEGLFVGADGYVYFCSETAGAVYRVPAAGGSVETIATEQPGARSVTVDASFVYWATNPGTVDGSIRRRPVP